MVRGFNCLVLIYLKNTQPLKTKPMEKREIFLYAQHVAEAFLFLKFKDSVDVEKKYVKTARLLSIVLTPNVNGLSVNIARMLDLMARFTTMFVCQNIFKEVA